MSYLSISNKYSMYSNLISQTYSTGSAGSFSASASNSLLGMYSYIYGANNNTATASAGTSSYLVDLKKEASTAVDTISSIKGTKTDASKIAANSDNSSAVSASYKGTEKRDDIKIDVSKIASAQINEGNELKSNSSSLYYSKANNITITDNNGKAHSFSYSPKITETDSKALSNIAQKINKANIGVTASVETDEKNKTSKLVLKGSKVGEENSFSVSGNLAEAIGINNVKQNASDAVYSINGEEKTSSSNEIKIDKDLTVNLKKATDETATISFGKPKLDTINAARSLVNAFNGMAHAAYSSDDSGAEKLGNRLASLAKNYGASLARIGVSLNSKGYLEIDEDKMDKAAENGELDKFFNSNSKKGLSYGFVNKVENLAKQASEDPTRFLSNSGRAEVNSVSDNSYYNYSKNNRVSYNYISSYYKYSNMALLFNAMI